jgi:hypothetical protein
VRNTRSGCGIMMLKRPSGVVTPAMPRGEPLGLAGVLGGHGAAVVHVAHGHQGLGGGRIAAGEDGTAFAVRDDHRQPGAGHAAEENRG